MSERNGRESACLAGKWLQLHIVSLAFPFWIIHQRDSLKNQGKCIPRLSKCKKHFHDTVAVFTPGMNMHLGWSQVNSSKHRCERTQDALRFDHSHSDVDLAAYGHILLAVGTQICPGPHSRTGYSTDVLCLSGSTYSKLDLSTMSEHFEKPIEIYCECIKVDFNNAPNRPNVWQVNSTHPLSSL